MAKTHLRISFSKLAIISAVAAWTANFAVAAKPVSVSYDDGGMPRCFYTPGERGALILHWDVNEHYRRQIKGTYFKWWKDCEGWENGRSNLINSQTVVVSSKTKTVFGFGFNSFVQKAIKQIEFGGRVYRTENTPKEYLAKYPINEFTVHTNRELASKYGVGFAGGIYRAWLLDKPENQEIRAALSKYLVEAKANKLETLHKRSKDVVFMFAPGLGQDPNNDQGHLPVNLSDIIRDFKAIGLNLVVFPVKPKGSVEDNAKVIKEEMAKVLKSGKDIILAGASKGVADMFLGTGKLANELGNLDNLPKEYGRIIAFVNISGVVRGSWVADRLAETKTYGFIQNIVSRLPYKWARNMSEYMVGIREMTSAYCQEIMKFYGPRLPKNTEMFNLVGIIPGDGLGTKENGIRGDSRVPTIMQLFAKYMVGYFGANDGYLELPQMTFPSNYRSNDYSVPFDSTHYILDGHYNGWDMTVASNRRAVFKSLFHTVMDRTEK